jgi:hypothetical protein
MGSLLSGTSLRALAWRWLHPPSARGLHSHLLGGYAGGKWRKRADFHSLAGAEPTMARALARSLPVDAIEGNEKP